MTAIEKLSAMYHEKMADRDLITDLIAYATWGTLIARPDLVAMARPVRREATDDELADPRVKWANPDAWLVWAVALVPPARLLDLRRMLPYPLPHLIFWRAGRGPWRREVNLEKLETHLHGWESISTATT